MKRTYIIPNVTVVEIHSHGMVAISTMDVSDKTYEEEGVMTDLVKEKMGHSVWDDDWNNE